MEKVSYFSSLMGWRDNDHWPPPHSGREGRLYGPNSFAPGVGKVPTPLGVHEFLAHEVKDWEPGHLEGRVYGPPTALTQSEWGQFA